MGAQVLTSCKKEVLQVLIKFEKYCFAMLLFTLWRSLEPASTALAAAAFGSYQSAQAHLSQKVASPDRRSTSLNATSHRSFIHKLSTGRISVGANMPEAGPWLAPGCGG